MKHYSLKPYLRTALLRSVRPALEVQSVDTLARAPLRLAGTESLQAYVMVFFREFLSRFCRGHNLMAYADDGFEHDAFKPEKEHPEITRARYVCNLQQEIFRRGLMGVPIRWAKGMSYAYRKVALLQRSFMWLLYFASMRIRGKLYSIIKFTAQSLQYFTAQLSARLAMAESSTESARLKPP